MYKIVTLEDTVRVPPVRFSEDLNTAIVSELEDTIVGKVSNDVGILLAITKVDEVGEGRVIRGDGAIYYDSKFKALVYMPMLHEVIEGNVTETLEFGAFVSCGPMDGLIHVSQITEDYMDYDQKGGVLTGKETKKILKQDDIVRARIVTISMKDRTSDSKIGLTMRQPYLGKKEWLDDEREAKKKKTTKSEK